MHIPHILMPTANEDMVLPSGQTVRIPKCQPVFERWAGEPPADTYGGKTVLDFNGQPAFAELVIVKMFHEAGWQGVWVDTFGSQYRTEYWPKNEVVLPLKQQALLRDIFALATSTKGCPDVFCWQNERVIFAEAKRTRQNKIRDTQWHWLQVALQHGLPIVSFLIVEWSVS